MKLFGSKKKKGRRKKPKKMDPEMLRRRAAMAGKFVVVVAVVAGAVVGIRAMDARVKQHPDYQLAPAIVLLDVPTSLESRIYELVDQATNRPWLDDSLCRDIATKLDDSPWVKTVRFVRRTSDATLEISADYREPTALVQIDGNFCLISDDGMRLPGEYEYHPSYVVIQGASAPPPAPGKFWPGEDIAVALEMIKRLKTEPFYDQITGVIVSNFEGRQSRHDPHIELAAAPSGSRILWGSPPGEEIEEPTFAQKVAILAENDRLWGRIDARRNKIDVSTFSDSFTTTDTVQ